MADDGYGRAWIMEHAIPIIESYDQLNLRQLYYRLVTEGLPNSQRHYGRVKSAMGDARWNGKLDFDTFVDNERDTLGSTDYEETKLDEKVEYAQEQVEAWMTSYRKNRWENQPIYAEVFIEKKALQGVFRSPCLSKGVRLCPCKGYPSISYLYEAAGRFLEAQDAGKKTVILYFGDYDPSGEDIPRDIDESIRKMGCYDVEVRRILLLEDQVRAMGLPPAPTKSTDPRTATWDGIGQVELDAIEPRTLEQYALDAISKVFDDGLHTELKDTERDERGDFQKRMKEFVANLQIDLDEDEGDEREDDEDEE